jgi:hypothetical protein
VGIIADVSALRSMQLNGGQLEQLEMSVQRCNLVAMFAQRGAV